MKNEMRLSLSVITGNAEKYVERFLDVFQPHFDEVVMVRAIGNQEEDRTLEIAEKRGCKGGIYYNESHASKDPKWFENPAAKWPHVDDFAAARNASAALCTGDWIMWADMDDTAEGLENLRSYLERMPEEISAIEMPYIIPEDGLTVMRERIFRRGAGQWVRPIHECVKLNEGAKIAHIPIPIIHSVIGGRSGSNDERNLRILESIPTDSRDITDRFHLCQSLRAVGRKDEALAEMMDLVQHPKVEKNEQFELWMSIAQLAPELPQKLSATFQSIATDPTRREGYGEMIPLCISAGKFDDALGYAKAMLAQPLPRDAQWNVRRKFYGHQAPLLHGMALRAARRFVEADVIEQNAFTLAGAKISLLHATRGRPRQAAKCRMEWIESADDPAAIEHIFAIDMDDGDSMGLTFHRHIILPGNGGPVAAWNAAAEASRGEILLQLSDDWKPFKGWDTAIIDAIGDSCKPAVLAVNDGHRKDDLLCMAILTRARYKDQGYLFFPEFFSMFSDNHFSQQAFTDGVVIDARDRITFEHMHPAFGKSEMDETYARSNDDFHYKTGEGIMRRIIAGITTSHNVHGWCDYRDFYSQVAKTLPDGAKIAEVGSWMGQSVIWLCQRLQDLSKQAHVHCVDTWKGEAGEALHADIIHAHGGSIFGAFKTNINAAEVADMIETHEGDSSERAADFKNGSLDFIFIDAAHDYDSVVKDLAAWYPKLKPGGIWSGHDYPHKDVEMAVKEHATANGYEVAQIGRCWVKTNE